MNFEGLTDEEIDALQAGIMEAKAKRGGAPVDNQPAEDERFAAIAASLEAMQAKIAAMDEEIDLLVKLVQEEIIDKVKAGVEDERRSSGIKSLAEKYGGKFDEYKDFYGKMTNGSDIYDKLWEELEEARNGVENWTEEAEGGKIEELLKGLSERRDSLKGSLGEAKEPEGGKALKIETVEAAPVDSAEEMKNMVAKMKARGGIPGMPK